MKGGDTISSGVKICIKYNIVVVVTASKLEMHLKLKLVLNRTQFPILRYIFLKIRKQLPLQIRRLAAPSTVVTINICKCLFYTFGIFLSFM